MFTEEDNTTINNEEWRLEILVTFSEGFRIFEAHYKNFSYRKKKCTHFAI